MCSRCYNVFMAIFNNYQKNRNSNHARKGACFSVTMPYSVESKLKEIQKSMGLNSRSQTIVFLIHHYEREQKAFDGIEKLADLVDKVLANESTLEKSNITKVKAKSDVVEQVELPYNDNN